MTGAVFSAAFMTFQYFELVRGYSPLVTSVYLLPWLATPMVVAPIAGAVSDRLGRRPVMTVGLLLQTIGFAWVALTVSSASTAAIVVALLVAGIGISMALPTVPTAVLNSVAPTEIGKASGINYMMQRFGAVFAIAIAGRSSRRTATSARPPPSPTASSRPSPVARSCRCSRPWPRSASARAGRPRLVSSSPQRSRRPAEQTWQVRRPSRISQREERRWL
jgi:hypothetical protein